MERDAARISRVTLLLTQFRTCSSSLSWHSTNRTGTDILAIHVWRRAGVSSASANIFASGTPFSPQSWHPYLGACAYRWLFLEAYNHRCRPYVEHGCTKHFMECKKVVRCYTHPQKSERSPGRQELGISKAYSRRSSDALPTFFLWMRICFV